MKFRKIGFLKYVPLVLIFASCTKDMETLNVNPKVATTVQGEMLFSNAEKAYADIMTTPNVNSGIFELISQYWAETTYPQESQYELGERNIPLNWWNTLYRDVVQDFNQSIILMRKQAADPTLLPADKIAYKNKIAIAKIFRSYAFSVIVNTFGDIPYTEALMGRDNLVPKYDKQKDVYYALLDTITASIKELDLTGDSFGAADLIYGGNVSAWNKFANSVQLKLGIIIADVDPAKSKTIVESVAPNVFASNSDNALLKYTTTPPNVNPIWTNLVQSGRKDFVAANTFMDTLKAHNDPRMKSYFDTSSKGTYIGGIYGNGNTYRNFSPPSNKIKAANFPAILIDYAEVKFLLAEGASRGMNVGGTAAEYYNEAVTASIIYWGGSETDASDYLAASINKFDAANWKSSIGVQQWIGYYTRGFDAWLSFRRLDYPQLKAPASARSAFPLRYTYPATEANLNKANLDAASTSIGGDKVETKLFWDKF